MTVKLIIETDNGTAREIAEAIAVVIAREHDQADRERYWPSRRSRIRAVPPDQPELPDALTASGDGAA